MSSPRDGVEGSATNWPFAICTAVQYVLGVQHERISWSWGSTGMARSTLGCLYRPIWSCILGTTLSHSSVDQTPVSSLCYRKGRQEITNDTTSGA